jgi:hypothetical protein
MSIPQSTLGEKLAAAFDDDEIETNTKAESGGKRPLRLSILAGTTPERYSTLFDANQTGLGLYNRFLLVPGVRNGYLAAARPPDFARVYDLQCATRDAIRITISGQPQMLFFSPEAEAVLGAWSTAKAAESLRKDTYRRIDVYVRRLAAGLMFLRRGVLEPPQAIDVDAVRAACALGDHQIAARHGNRVLTGETQWARYEQQIRRYIRPRLASESDGVSSRAMQQSLHAHRWGVGVFKRALEALIGNEELAFVKVPIPTRSGAKNRKLVTLGAAGLLPDED